MTHLSRFLFISLFSFCLSGCFGEMQSVLDFGEASFSSNSLESSDWPYKPEQCQTSLPLPETQFANVYYFDGVGGSNSNSGASPELAKRDIIKQQLPSSNVVLRLKRGTKVYLNDNFYPQNVVIEDYGDSSRPKPILANRLGEEYWVVPQGGHVTYRNIEFVNSNPSLTYTAAPVEKAEAALIEGIVAKGFYNGIKFAGVGTIIRNNQISAVSNNGIYGGDNDLPAPAKAFICGNYIDATDASGDSITLHDGLGVGAGNMIVGNYLIAGRENGVDILGQYDETSIVQNFVTRATMAGIIVSPPDDPAIVRVAYIQKNVITEGLHAGIWARSGRVYVTENSIAKMKTQSGAALLLQREFQAARNRIELSSADLRSAVAFMQDKPEDSLPRGEFTDNTIINRSSQQSVGVRILNTSDLVTTMQNIIIDQNRYSVLSEDGQIFGSETFSTWQSRNWGGSHAYKDKNSILTVLTAE